MGRLASWGRLTTWKRVLVAKAKVSWAFFDQEPLECHFSAMCGATAKASSAHRLNRCEVDVNGDGPGLRFREPIRWLLFQVETAPTSMERGVLRIIFLLKGPFRLHAD